MKRLKIFLHDKDIFRLTACLNTKVKTASKVSAPKHLCSQTKETNKTNPHQSTSQTKLYFIRNSHHKLKNLFLKKGDFKT